MPLSPNALFVDRLADLKALAAAFEGGPGKQVVLMGTSGVGKSETAAAFVHRYGQFFAGGVFWISFDDPGTIAAQVAAVGGGTGMALHTDFEKLPFEDQVGLVQAAWESFIPRLLIFDHCDSDALLTRWRPKVGGCSILLTSREENWNANLGVRAMPLRVLARKDSVALLRKQLSDAAATHTELDAIAAQLGDLPLALNLAASYLRLHRHVVTPAAYLRELRDVSIHDRSSGMVADETSRLDRQDPTVPLALTVQRLRTDDPTDVLARSLLARAAYMAPGEPFQRELLVASLAATDTSNSNGPSIEDALGRIVEVGLLGEEDDGSFRIHPLVAAFVQGLPDDAQARADIESEMLQRVRNLNVAYETAPVSLQRHLRAITDIAVSKDDELAGALSREVGAQFYLSGDHQGARTYIQQALAINERVLGPDDLGTASTLSTLAVLLHDDGDYAGARSNLERALAVYEKVLGQEHPATAGILNNLGALLREQGEYAAAQPYLLRALRLYETALGPEHPYVAASLANLGVLLREQKHYAEAREYLERALAINRRTLGPDDPDTAASLTNLGVLLQEQGDTAGARQYLEEALTINERVLGHEHPETAMSLNNLGSLLRDEGDLAGARGQYERANTILEGVLGWDDPAIATTLENLGAVLQAEGDVSSACQYLSRALLIWQAQGERYREALCFFLLGQLAISLDRVSEGAKLVAVNYLIHQEIGDRSAMQDLQDLFILASGFGYSDQDINRLLQEVSDAYTADRGQALLLGAFPDLPTPSLTSLC